ncbi:hypothetical protein LRAMOSA08250 [Lichtheimia ramosa]|uniref:Uncharacterized protein n=1 Tax=Lichtheimia ramosa TaxID=688394 RepID=A0A077WGB5_9FUNG|nr:hypothetical protein LRAMOSA08250 [Lichtheimia ramosa]
MPPVLQNDASPYYMNSIMKRFGHHLSTDQTQHLTGRMAASLHSAPEGSSCSLPRSINDGNKEQEKKELPNYHPLHQAPINNAASPSSSVSHPIQTSKKKQ